MKEEKQKDREAQQRASSELERRELTGPKKREAPAAVVVTMKSLVEGYFNKDVYGGDLDFLKEILWPLVKHDSLSHDAYSCTKFQSEGEGVAKGFPTQRPRNFQHVGQVFDASNQPRQSDIDGWIRGVETPKECRRNPAWKYG